MENNRFINVSHVCEHYNIELTFVRSLQEYGLIELVRTDEAECIEESKLSELERLLHLHYDLDINLEGIDAISHLLKRVEEMQKELIILKNRLG
jgi:hypothetical protein